MRRITNPVTEGYPSGMSNVYSEPSNVDFTFGWYRTFLERLRSDGYRFRSFEEGADGDGVFLRHDVDLSISAALDVARLEANLDVTSTYLFLLTSPLYNPFEAEQRARIEEIADLGHDVGLHFSTHQYWPKEDPPEEEALRDRVVAERSAMETMVDVDVAETTSFHIPPEWMLDREIAGLQSTYEPAFFSEMGYVADSGQRWRDDPPTVGSLPDRVQVLTHPGLWGDVDAEFERRIEAAADDAVTRTRLQTHREFIDGAYS